MTSETSMAGSAATAWVWAGRNWITAGHPTHVHPTLTSANRRAGWKFAAAAAAPATTAPTMTAAVAEAATAAPGSQQHSQLVVVGSSSQDAPTQTGLQRQPYVRPPSRTAVLTGLITSCSSLQALVALHQEGCDPWDHIHCCAALSRLAKLSGSSTHTRTNNTPQLQGADASSESDRSAGSRDSSSSSSIPGSSSSSSSGGSGGGMSHPDENLSSDPDLPNHVTKQGFMLQVLQQVLQPRLRARLRGREVANLIWAMAKIGWDPLLTPAELHSPTTSSTSQPLLTHFSLCSSSSSSSSSSSAAAHGLRRLSHSGALWKLNPQELSNILYALATAPLPTTHTPTPSFPQPQTRALLSERSSTTALSRKHDSSRHDDDNPPRHSSLQQRAGQVHALASALQAGFPQCGPQALSNAIWALSRLSYQPSQDWMRGFLACSEPLLHDFTDQGLAITAVAMARLQFRPPLAWRNSLLDAVWRLLPRARSGQAAANTLWAMVAMGQAPPDAWVDACLASLANRPSSLSEEDLSNAFVAAAKTRRRPPPEAVDALLGRAYDLMPGSSLKAVASVVSALAVLQLRPSGGWMNRLLNCVYKAAAVMISSDATSSIPHSSMQQQSSSSGPFLQADSQPISDADSNQEDRRLAGTVGSGNSEIRPVRDDGCRAIAAVLKALSALEFKPTRRWLEGVLVVLERRSEAGLLMRVDAAQAVAACDTWGHDPGVLLLRAARLLPEQLSSGVDSSRELETQRHAVAFPPRILV
ncbi:MAG: hypothetical protein WDW38_004594 [Sanguina aurantia]